MEGKCTNIDCPAPISCHEGNDVKTCQFWLDGQKLKKDSDSKKSSSLKKTNLTWTGEPLFVTELPLIAERSMLILIGVVGKANAAKTTFLAMLYTLLLNGNKLKKFDFAGSKTLLGWDRLHHKLKVLKNQVSYPDPTLPTYLRMLHLGLRDKAGRLKDILFSDASGEVFTTWSQKHDDENAENAQWIHANSDAFIFFIDCDDLVKRKNAAKTEIIDIAEMLSRDLKDRPVIAVWSKADLSDQIIPAIKESLQNELKRIFRNYDELNISNFSVSDPDHLVHTNNLAVIDWILERIFVKGTPIQNQNEIKDDYFLNYRGNG